MATRYRIHCIAVCLTASHRIREMTVRMGNRLTTVCGPLPDTAALYGLTLDSRRSVWHWFGPIAYGTGRSR